MALTVSVSMTDIRAAADKLREVDKDLPGELRYLLKKAALPIMREQRKRIRSMAIRNPGDKLEIRDIIARGLRLTVRTGGGRRGTAPAYRIRTTMPTHPDREHWAMLPRGFDTSFNGWRSPYFGNRNHWVHHRVQGSSWFMGPAQEAQPRLRAQVQRLLEMTAGDIALTAARTRHLRGK